MQKTYTQVLGVFFLVIGLAAFVSAIAPVNDHGMLLFGIFQVNPAQNLIHILSGIVALATVMLAKDYYISTYVKVFGVVYALVAIWGLPGLTGSFDGVLFGLIHVNVATELLHIAIGAVGVYLGFFANKAAVKASV